MFNVSRRSALLGMMALATVRAGVARAADEVLPSWNDGPAKQAIIKFVQQTTDAASAQFVPPEQRIAAFDQDGTLWVEKPALFARLSIASTACQPWSRRSRNLQGSSHSRP